MTPKPIKPRRARRAPYLGPIDLSKPRRAESDVRAAMRSYLVEQQESTK